MAAQQHNLEEYLKLALKLAQDAGKMISEAMTKTKTITTKSHAVDVVTETDKKCEEMILGVIKQKYPDHNIIAEESHEEDGKYDFTDTPTWLVDPVDGTTNFVHQFPMSCVSIGLAINRQSVMGVVHNPTTQETYHAIKGGGAFLNGKPIHTSTVKELSSAVLVTEVGYERSKDGVEVLLGRLRKVLLGNIQAIRACGSCALNICYIAAGKMDIYYEGFNAKQGPKPWDMGAAIVILTEAGGVHGDFQKSQSNKPFTMCDGRIMAAANTILANKLMDLLDE